MSRWYFVGLALVLFVGGFYLTWRGNTRGRMLGVAEQMEQELAVARGSGPPTDESIAARIVEMASAREVTIEELSVSHEVVDPPTASASSQVGSSGVAAYTVSGVMHAEHMGFEHTSPLRGLVRITYNAP